MNQIQDLPEDRTFGLTFDYSLWTPGTVLTLANVRWTSDYRDIVHFANQAALDAHIDTNAGERITIGSTRYVPPGYPVRVNIPFNVANRHNYLRIANPAQPISGDTPQTFYYFINEVRYLSPDTTELVVQLDVWQSYNKHVKIGRCYIERGHIGIANENNFDKYGREYLTVPEGFDLGNEYEINKANRVGLINTRDDVETGVIVASTTKLTPSFGTLDNPILQTSEGSNFEGLPNGCTLYYFSSVLRFKRFVQFMSDKPWITQGIISIMPCDSFVGGNVGSWVPYENESGLPVEDRRIGVLAGNTNSRKLTISGSFRNNILPARYSNLKKFLTYPYTFVELTTFSGTPLVIKPEMLPSDGVPLTIHTHYAPPSPRIMITVDGYNMASDKTFNSDFPYESEYLDAATGVTSLPTFSIPNNSYLNYMASNANSIAYQHSSADWSQQRALAGAGVSAQQATANMELASTLTNQGVGAADAQTQLSVQTAGTKAAISAATGMATGLGRGPGGLLGGAANAALSGVNFAVDANQMTGSTAISNQLAQSQTGSRNRTAGFMRDTNLAYAQMAAQGDYSNAIAGINAKVQDARMIPPTTVGQVGGDAFNMAIDRLAVFARVKTLTPAAMASIGEFWLRYGYAVNRFGNMPSNYQVMSKFTFWKLKETYITSQTCPELFRNTIRGIFEKGVTVWSNPNEIGSIDVADNAPKAGITL